MLSKIKRILEFVTSQLGYPRGSIKLINISPTNSNIQIGERSKISRGCRFSGDVTIGDNVSIGPESLLNGDILVRQGTNLNESVEIHGNVQVGKYCAIAPKVSFRQHNHATDKPSLQDKFYRENFDTELETVANGPITIGNDVWIGSRSIILSGVSIGDGAIIGAGSIVTQDIEPYSVSAGVPAEHKKWRFDEVIRDELSELEWWDWPKDRIQSNQKFFNTNLNNLESIQEVLDL